MVELSSPHSFSVASGFLFPLEKLETVCKIKQRKILFLKYHIWRACKPLETLPFTELLSHLMWCTAKQSSLLFSEINSCMHSHILMLYVVV